MKKYTYDIYIQFADNSAYDNEAKEIIKEGISYYNTRSRIAKNPKKICNNSYPDDMTLEVTLESECELAYPTKALKLLSSHLIENTQMAKHLLYNQLFKMSVATPNNVEKITIFKKLDTDEKLIEIYKLLLINANK